MTLSYETQLKDLHIESIQASDEEHEQNVFTPRIDSLVTEVLNLEGDDDETHRLKALAAVVFEGKPNGPEPTDLAHRVNHVALVELGRLIWPDMPADEFGKATARTPQVAAHSSLPHGRRP